MPQAIDNSEEIVLFSKLEVCVENNTCRPLAPSAQVLRSLYTLRAKPI